MFELSDPETAERAARARLTSDYSARRAMRALEDAGLMHIELGPRGGMATAKCAWLPRAYLAPSRLAPADDEALGESWLYECDRLQMDPSNALAVRFLQSRPTQIGTDGFLISVAQDLELRGSLSGAQRESIEGIAKKSNWEPKDPLRPAVDDRGQRVLIYVTPGCPPAEEFMAAITERYRPAGKIGMRVVHDPVDMALLNPANVQSGTPYRLLTSGSVYPITGTGYAFPGFKPRREESADTLNDVVSPLLSTPDTEYRFRNHLVDKVKSGGGRTWWVFGERRMREAAQTAA